MILVFLLYALFASVFTTAKAALEHTQPFFLVGSRMLFAGVLLLAFQWFRDPKALTIPKQSWRNITLLAFFSIFLTNVCEFWGLKYLTSFKTCFIYSLSPFASALLSYFILKERMTQKKWIGLVAGFVGFLPILLSQSSSETIGGQLWIFSWAELAVVCAALSSVYGWILLRQTVSSEISPISANGYAMVLGGSMALIQSLCTEKWDPIPVSNYASFMSSALILIIVSNLICYNLYGFLLKRYSATFMSFAGFTTPLFSALFGWLFLQETVSWPFVVSFVGVLCGLLIFYQDELLQSQTVVKTVD